MALGDLFGGFISDIASGLYSELPAEVTGAFADVPQATEPDVTFQPFTVTSGGIGSVTGGPSGTTYDLSPQQQEISNILMNEAQFRLGGDPRGALESHCWLRRYGLRPTNDRHISFWSISAATGSTASVWLRWSVHGCCGTTTSRP